MEQKFKRGNLVKVLVGHQVWSSKEGVIDIAPQNVGRKAIIDYSYAEKYGNGKPSKNNKYAIVWADTGSSEAWKDDDELELIEDGGEYLFAEAKANGEALSKANIEALLKTNTYNISLECVETNEQEDSKALLRKLDYKRMTKCINEIIYIDDNNKQWALIKIEKL
jgi:hypothetical protein